MTREAVVARLREPESHFECEDGWYSCATLTFNDARRSDKCDCGADRRNKERSDADTLIAELAMLIEGLRELAAMKEAK